MEDIDIKKIVREVYDSLESKGYDPINQIGGYLITDDLGYIPEFDNNRKKVAMIDRTLLIEDMIKEYLK